MTPSVRVGRVVLAALCVGLVACGTTANLPPGMNQEGIEASGLGIGAGAAPVAAGSGLTTPAAGGAPTLAGSSASAPAVGTAPGALPNAGASPAAVTATPETTPSAAPAGTSVAAPASTTGVGVTAKTISIGIDTFSNAQAVSAAGLSGVPTLGGPQSYQAVISYLNSHGGVAGRQLEPVFFEEPIGSSTAAQSVCDDMTQDHHVFAVISDRNHFDGNMLACLTPKNTPLINDYEGYYDGTMVNTAPAGMYLPDFPGGQRTLTDTIDALNRAGFFSPGSKVGLVTSDDPIYQQIAKAVAPALAGIGIKLAAESSIDTIDTAQIASQTASSVLSFKAAGIDHVLIMDVGLELTILWPEAAQSQAYYPRYGLNSENDTAIASENLPARQLQGALGLGWDPQLDVSIDVPTPSSATTLCTKMYAAEGVSLAGANNETIAQAACGMLFFFKTAFERTTTFTSAGFATAVNSLGSSWVSPVTFATSFGPGRHDGTAGYRLFSYGTACSCFEYTGPVESMP